MAAVVTGKSAHHHGEIERDAVFRFTMISQTDQKGCERRSLTEAEYTVERRALLEQRSQPSFRFQPPLVSDRSVVDIRVFRVADVGNSMPPAEVSHCQ